MNSTQTDLLWPLFSGVYFSLRCPAQNIMVEVWVNLWVDLQAISKQAKTVCLGLKKRVIRSKFTNACIEQVYTNLWHLYLFRVICLNGNIKYFAKGNGIAAP